MCRNRDTKYKCEGKYLTNIPSEQNLVKGLCANMMIHKMKPVAIVEYERIPYVYKDGNVRITFDMKFIITVILFYKF